jgi:hypothetical protein
MQTPLIAATTGFAAVFQRANHRAQRRLGARFRCIELANVGAAGKRLAGACEHDRVARRVGVRTVEAGRRRRCASRSRAR